MNPCQQLVWDQANFFANLPPEVQQSVAQQFAQLQIDAVMACYGQGDNKPTPEAAKKPSPGPGSIPPRH